MRGIQQDGTIPLTSGAYSTRALVADSNRCENLYPELNPEETTPASPVTHYARPGLRALGGGNPTPAIGRGIFTASNGNLFAVSGPNVFAIDRNWTYNLLGQVGNGNTPVSFADNGVTGVFVDGGALGYTVNLADNSWGGILQDPTGTFVGSVRADYMDTFLTFAMPGTNEWTCSLGLQVAFNALQTGAAASYPDQIITHAVNLRNVFLFKQFTTETWYLSGAVPFPFEEWPNQFIPYGIAGPYALARADSNLFWLSRNKDGQVIAVMNDGTSAVKAISTRALEYRWSLYPTVQDCLLYTYQQAGHTFVIFHFPMADESWGYDLSTKQWHRRTWCDGNGLLHRERVAFHAAVTDKNGYPPTNVGMDWATGHIYALDQNLFTDVGGPIVCIRSFPHILSNLNNVTIPAITVDLATGTIPNTGEINQQLSPWSQGFSNGFGPLLVNESPQIALRLSRDGGGTWGNFRKQGFVSAGRYRSPLRWRGNGMGRDMVFEISFPAYKMGLQQAYLGEPPIQHAA